MKIKLIFDIAQYMLYVPDGYITNLKHLQMDFFEWCKTQKDAFSTAPGNKFAYCYSKELFLQYINEIVLSESTERAYFINNNNKQNKKTPTIVF